MINRINLILRAKNITARQFAEEIGIQPSGMSHIMGGRNNPSLDFVAKVLRRYPEIDANWLLLGRGEMYRTDVPMSLQEYPAEPVIQREAQQNGAGTDLFSQGNEVHSAPFTPVEEPSETAEVIITEEKTTEESPMRVQPVTRRITKLLLVYSDGTFEECSPAC